MEAISEFVAMGGHGIYIWPAYGIAAVVMIAFALTTVRRLRIREAELARLTAARRDTDAEAEAGP